VFWLAVRKGWAPSNPVEVAARPKRRRAGDADPDLQFVTPAELDRVIEMVPDHVVDKDALGPVMRVLLLAAGTTGLRQSELLGMRWRDVDMRAQCVRVRNAWVRYEHSGERKSDLSTKRSVPMTDRLTGELCAWRLRTVYSDNEDLVFGHPDLGVPLDRTKVTRKFKAACEAAGVRVIRFHDPTAHVRDHAGGGRRAAAHDPGLLGHADLKTTQTYAPSAQRSRSSNDAFGTRPAASRRRHSR
jgi:integrase